jgi:hypothetical protein
MIARWTGMAMLCVPSLAYADPYSYFGGEIEVREKNPAIEDCEYRVLVEEQRCNNSLYKSQCIRDVHAECIELHEPNRDQRPGALSNKKADDE